VGGAPGVITVHARPERSGTYRSFCDALLQGRSITGDAHRHAENRAVAAAITDDPQGIGFVPAFASGGTKVLGIGHDATSGFYLPTHDHVREAKYPPSLCRYVYFYVPAEEPKAYTAEARINWQTAREFARMSQSWRGQLIVAASGFVPEVAFTDADGQLSPKANESALTYAERLTATAAQLKNGKLLLQPKLPDGEICSRLLFGENQTALSPESRNALQLKLPAWLELYPNAAPGGFIAEGWTDDLTRDAQAIEISNQRAHTAASIVSAVTGQHVNEIGKGNSPYPPNDSEENKHMNRRVVLKIAPK
jgi:outer membrane protein OmpA-like peptidoglycan-associated protein